MMLPPGAAPFPMHGQVRREWSGRGGREGGQEMQRCVWGLWGQEQAGCLPLAQKDCLQLATCDGRALMQL